MAAQIRLQKYLSECGEASRRKAEEMIVEGRVKVNDKVVTELGTKVTPGKDRVKIGRRSINPPKRGMIVLNKPKGMITSMSDPGGRRTVADFLDKRDRGYVPVGRLDYESTGLVIMTNDGELANRLMHPRYGIARVYHIRVAGYPSDKTLRRVERGVKLDDGIAKAKVKRLREGEDWSWLEVVIGEGRNRIVRRLFEHVKHPVTKLHRVAHGPVKLGKLKVGEAKRLTDEQYDRIRERVFGVQQKK